MGVSHRKKRQMNFFDRDGDIHLHRFQRSTSGANACCWLRRVGFHAPVPQGVSAPVQARGYLKKNALISYPSRSAKV